MPPTSNSSNTSTVSNCNSDVPLLVDDARRTNQRLMQMTVTRAQQPRSDVSDIGSLHDVSLSSRGSSKASSDRGAGDNMSDLERGIISDDDRAAMRMLDMLKGQRRGETLEHIEVSLAVRVLGWTAMVLMTLATLAVVLIYVLLLHSSS